MSSHQKALQKQLLNLKKQKKSLQKKQQKQPRWLRKRGLRRRNRALSKKIKFLGNRLRSLRKRLQRQQKQQQKLPLQRKEQRKEQDTIEIPNPCINCNDCTSYNHSLNGVKRRWCSICVMMYDLWCRDYHPGNENLILWCITRNCSCGRNPVVVPDNNGDDNGKEVFEEVRLSHDEINFGFLPQCLEEVRGVKKKPIDNFLRLYGTPEILISKLIESGAFVNIFDIPDNSQDEYWDDISDGIMEDIPLELRERLSQEANMLIGMINKQIIHLFKNIKNRYFSEDSPFQLRSFEDVYSEFTCRKPFFEKRDTVKVNFEFIEELENSNLWTTRVVKLMIGGKPINIYCSKNLLKELHAGTLTKSANKR